MNWPILSVTGLTKTFHTKGTEPVLAVNDVTLKVMPGEIYGFLGPNGAGKTTVIRSILGLIEFDRGEVRLFGKPPRDRRETFSRVGYCPDAFSFPDELTCRENLRFLAALHSIKPKEVETQIDRVIVRLGLHEVADRPGSVLSLGTRQRFMIAQALLGQPEILFLDEPTQGLDPIGVGELRALLRELSEFGVTIFLNSHQLSEVEKVCHRVGILNQGRLLMEDTLRNVLAAGGVERFFIEVVKGQKE